MGPLSQSSLVVFIFIILSCACNVIIAALSSSKVFQNMSNKRSAREVENFVPIRSIPGTDLYTGIYYSVGLKRFASGAVTWTEESNSGGWNYVQIDARAENIGSYEKSGVWYNDTQWFFVPSDTEDGWYTLRNRQLPEALMTWSKTEPISESNHSFYIILNRKADPSSADCLLKPVLQKNGTDISYNLRIKSVPEGVVTWTFKEYGGKDSHYIQVDMGNKSDPSKIELYKPGNEWYEDTLFTFEDIEREFVGEITQLELQLFSKLDELRSHTHTDCDSVPSTIFINVESSPLSKQIKQDILNKGELTLKLHGPLSQFPFMKLTSSEGHLSPPWYAGSVDFHTLKSEYYSNDDIRLQTIEQGNINTNVIIPAWSTTEVRVCREYFLTFGEEIDIDTFVFVEVSEKSYRASNSKRKFEAVYTKLPAAEFTHRRFESMLNVTKLIDMDIDERWGLKSASPGNVNNDNEPNEESEFEKNGYKILGSRESDLLIVLRGSVRGRFGYRGVVASN